MNGDNQKKRYISWDYARIISAFLVIVAHLSEAVHNAYGRNVLFISTSNSGLGSVAVVVFFLISGASLAVSNAEIADVKTFYKKRFKSIFPLFWALWMLMYIKKCISAHSLFWGGHPLKLLLSFIGMDGYFYYLSPNYYSLGEWFLGIIILMYVFYPILLRIRKLPGLRLGFDFLLVLLYVLNIIIDPFKMNQFRNPISCLFVFYVGIIIGENAADLDRLMNTYKGAIVGAVLFVFLLITVIVPMPFVNFVVITDITGILLFANIVFFYNLFVGKHSGEEKKDIRFLVKLSKATYAVFLVQHILINNVFLYFFSWFDNDTISNIMVLICSVIIFAIGVFIDILWDWIVSFFDKTQNSIGVNRG